MSWLLIKNTLLASCRICLRFNGDTLVLMVHERVSVQECWHLFLRARSTFVWNPVVENHLVFVSAFQHRLFSLLLVIWLSKNEAVSPLLEKGLLLKATGVLIIACRASNLLTWFIDLLFMIPRVHEVSPVNEWSHVCTLVLWNQRWLRPQHRCFVSLRRVDLSLGRLPFMVRNHIAFQLRHALLFAKHHLNILGGQARVDQKWLRKGHAHRLVLFAFNVRIRLRGLVGRRGSSMFLRCLFNKFFIGLGLSLSGLLTCLFYFVLRFFRIHVFLSLQDWSQICLVHNPRMMRTHFLDQRHIRSRLALFILLLLRNHFNNQIILILHHISVILLPCWWKFHPSKGLLGGFTQLLYHCLPIILWFLRWLAFLTHPVHLVIVLRIHESVRNCLFDPCFFFNSFDNLGMLIRVIFFEGSVHF